MCTVKFNVAEKYVLIELEGELTLASSNDVKERAKNFLANHPTTNVILDLSKLEMVDSSGLGILISLFKQVNQNQREIIYCGANDYVMKIFGFAKLDKIFSLSPSIEQAKEKLNIV